MDNIALFIWIGTCDLTVRNGKYISLRSDNDDSIDKLIQNFEEIEALFKTYTECSLTFLEIPVYSIFEYNKKQGHKDHNQFISYCLIQQVHKANERNRQINTRLDSSSPNFCLDLSHNKVRNTKNQHIRLRDKYNFTLYRDGVHPSINLSKVWLRKIV